MSSEGEIIHERRDKIRQEEVWRSKRRVSIVNVSREEEEEEEENGVNNKKKNSDACRKHEVQHSRV